MGEVEEVKSVKENKKGRKEIIKKKCGMKIKEEAKDKESKAQEGRE